MFVRRKDSGGKVLLEGESERSDGRYQYRYTDIQGKRHTIYAGSLNELRKKEEGIKQAECDGISYAAGQLKVHELVGRCLEVKKGLRKNTMDLYGYFLKELEKDDFGNRMVGTVKTSDAKAWVSSLQKSGKRYGTIRVIMSLLRQSFQMAYEDDVIKKNPFDFVLTNTIKNDTEQRQALTPEQVGTWLNFIRKDSFFSRYYDEYVVLLGTGMRIGEMCGLTTNDLDFDNNRIYVERQLIYGRDATVYIGDTKSSSGRRIIPMFRGVKESLLNILENRQHPPEESIIDGVCGFLLIDAHGRPKLPRQVESAMRQAMVKFRKKNPNSDMPKISPHVLRHTFCTNMACAGMNVKSLQYIMGHANARITLNVYAHVHPNYAADEMSRIEDSVAIVPEIKEEKWPDLITLDTTLTPISFDSL